MMAAPVASSVSASSDRAWAGAANLLLILFAIGSIGLSLVFGNRQGWEGDDANLIYGISHLEALGRPAVYRYAWQPLSYELLATWSARGLVAPHLAVIGNATGAFGVALLAWLCARLLGGGLLAVTAAILTVISVSEFWVGTLYFNTTALGLPFFVAALLLASVRVQAAGSTPLLLSAGAMFALACLTRLDYLVAGPFALWFVMANHSPWRRPLASFAAAAATVLVLALLMQPDWPVDLWRIFRLYGSEHFEWTPREAVKVLLAAILPAVIVWPLLFFGRRASISRHGPSVWLLLLTLLPLAAPASKLYSGKYLVPMLVCLVVLLCYSMGLRRLLATAHVTSRWRVCLAVLLMAISVFVGVPNRHVNAATSSGKAEPLQIRSHDGIRTLGAYAWLVGRFAAVPLFDRELELMRLTALEAARCSGDQTIVMPKDAWQRGLLMAAFTIEGWHLVADRFPGPAEMTKGMSTLRVVEEPPVRAIGTNSRTHDYRSLLSEQSGVFIAAAIDRLRQRALSRSCAADLVIR